MCAIYQGVCYPHVLVLRDKANACRVVKPPTGIRCHEGKTCFFPFVAVLAARSQRAVIGRMSANGRTTGNSKITELLDVLPTEACAELENSSQFEENSLMSCSTNSTSE
jgi:hypothetical protein